MRPQDPELAHLLNQYVPVRIVNFKGVDMNLFKFDYDLTFAVLLMNADGRTYARYGSQDHRSSADRMSIPGLKKAMREVLSTHKERNPAAPPPAAAAPFTVADYPAFRTMKAAKDACYHCHYANNARIAQLRLDGKFTKEMLFQYPHPENIGLALDVDRNNVVKTVLPGSPAQRAGVQAGDVVVRAGSTPVVTPADLQFALDPLPDPGTVALHLERGGKRLPAVTLQLPRGWRRSDISWRPSQGEVPPQVGFWGVVLNEGEKRQHGIPADRLAIRANFMFPGAAAARSRGGLQSGDIVVGLNGQQPPHMTTRQFHSHFRLTYNVGDRVTLNVIRGGQRLDLPVEAIELKE